MGQLADHTGQLRAENDFTPPQAFPFGCYGAVVEMDYSMPTMAELPPLVLNAIADAPDLDEPGRIDLPATPERVRRALQEDPSRI